MNMVNRVKELEKQLGMANERKAFRLSFVGCNPDASGADRVIQHPVTAFQTIDGAQRWELGVGETEAQLWERAASEVGYTEWGVAVLMECCETPAAK
jgi:hypothetical protein